MIELDTSTHPGVAVLTMTHGDNRFRPDFCDAFEAALDTVDAVEAIGALVITGTGKFFSNGFDIEVLMELGAEAPGLVARSETIAGRLMAAPYTVVMAINGHAFGMGAMFSLSGDVRLMRSDRGFWCLPEADLGMPFSPGMQALITGALRRTDAAFAMTTATRFDGEAAVRVGVAHAAHIEAELLPAAIEAATAASGRRGPNLAGIKNQLHAAAIASLGQRLG